MGYPQTSSYVRADSALNLASIARIGSSVRLNGCSTRPKIPSVTAALTGSTESAQFGPEPARV